MAGAILAGSIPNAGAGAMPLATPHRDKIIMISNMVNVKRDLLSSSRLPVNARVNAALLELFGFFQR